MIGTEVGFHILTQIKIGLSCGMWRRCEANTEELREVNIRREFFLRRFFVSSISI